MTARASDRGSRVQQVFDALLGLPLAEATLRLEAEQRSFRLALTAPPRCQPHDDRLRVVGIRSTGADLVLVVAAEVGGSDQTA